MKILFEVNLVNIDKDGKDHFAERKKERLLFAEPILNPLISIASKENNISREELLNKVNEEFRYKIQENIGKAAKINVQYAVIPVGILYVKYKDRQEPFNYSSESDDIDENGKKIRIKTQGHVFYIPVTNNVASTLMRTNNEVVGDWKRQHSTRKIPIEKIEVTPLPGVYIVLDLEKVIEDINQSKIEKPKEEIPNFNISDLLYEVDSDYRPKRAGKQNMFNLKIFGGRSFPIISTSGDEFQKDVKVKVSSANEAEILSSRLTGKKNGVKNWEVKKEGLFVIFKDCYTTLSFDSKGVYRGKKVLAIAESQIRNYIRLLSRLSRCKVKLSD